MYHYYDLLFKEIFGTQKNIIYLEALLEDLKELSVGALSGKIKILNGAPLNKTNIKDKNIISDVLAKVEKETINLEMYTYFNEEAFKKSKVYLFRLYSTQLKVGSKYQEQPNVSQYNLCLETSIPHFQKFQSGFVLKETDTNVIVSDDLVGHVYSLDKKYFNLYTVGESYRERLIKMFQILISKNDKERRIKTGKELPTEDLWAFGSPCTNISVAGNRVGLKGEQSSMFFEVIRLLNDRSWEEKPAVLLMENVKNLLSSNRGWDFATVINKMDEAGYDVEWEVFNSSWTIPQNRERVYIVGHKRGIAYTPVFPISRQNLEAKRKYNVLRDVLEQKVDEKFYLSKDKVEQLLVNDKKSTFSNGGDIKVVGNTSNTRYRSHDVVDSCGVSKTITASEGVKVNSLIGIGVLGNTSNTGHHTEDVLDEKGLSKTLTAASFKHPVQIATEVKQVGNISHSTSFGGNPQTGRVYDESGLSPTLNTMQGGGREPKVLVEPCLTPDRVNKRQNGRRFKNNDEPSFTLTAADRHGILLSNGKTYVIRKLTPLECWRLQGFTDEQFNKAKEAGVSNSQLYKQAGNAVTIPVVEAIGEKLNA